MRTIRRCLGSFCLTRSCNGFTKIFGDADNIDYYYADLSRTCPTIVQVQRASRQRSSWSEAGIRLIALLLPADRIQVSHARRHRDFRDLQSGRHWMGCCRTTSRITSSSSTISRPRKRQPSFRCCRPNERSRFLTSLTSMRRLRSFGCCPMNWRRSYSRRCPPTARPTFSGG